MSQAVTSEVFGGCVLPSCGNGTVSVGKTTTGEPGTDAKVSNSGTNKHVILDFEIPRGDEGISAYEVAVKNGYEGTEEEWLASLKGDEGISAYEVAVKDGYVGTEEEWLASLKGDTGDRGPAGVESVSASIPSSDTPGTPSVTATLVDGAMSLAFEHLKGETGEKGDKGDQGNTGSSVDYPYELVNNCTTDDATKGLSAAQGVVLKGEVSQLAQKATDKSPGLNLLDKNAPDVKIGYYLDGNTLRADSNYNTSGFIKVDANSDYSKSIQQGGGFRFISFYTIDKAYISNLQNKSTFTTPANCEYIRVTTYSYPLYWNYAQVAKGDTQQDFAEYNPIDGYLQEGYGEKLISLVGFGADRLIAGVTADGEQYYNTNTKKIIKALSVVSAKYVDIPFYTGAIYSCKGKLYQWNGTDLVETPYPLGKTTFSETAFTTQLNKAKTFNVSIPDVVFPSGEEYIISVDTQADFDNFPDLVISALANGETNIIVLLRSGVYHFSNTHLQLHNLEYPNASIGIIGIGEVTLVGGGERYSIESTGAELVGSRVKVPYRGAFTYGNLFSDELGNPVKFLYEREYEQCSSQISVGTLSDGFYECVIGGTDYQDKQESECSDLYINITRWYEVVTCKVKEIENGNIHFLLPSGGISINSDYTIGGVFPRFRLINYNDGNNLCVEGGHIYFPARYDSIYESRNGCFVSIQNGKYKTFTFSGIRFVNNCGLTPLFNLAADSCESFIITNCKFTGGCVKTIRSRTENLHIVNNEFEELDGAIQLTTTSESVEIKNNIFRNIMRSSCIVAICKNLRVTKNKFVDFQTCAVSLGANADTLNASETTAIVDNNEIRQTEDFQYRKVSLMDLGAIYCATRCDDVVIRHNVILGYCGMYANSGIFLDDGAKNVTIFGNLISLGFASNVDLSINSRLVSSVGDRVPDYNTNNVAIYNIVNSTIKIQGKDASASCYKGLNFLLPGVPNSIVSNCNTEDDMILVKAEMGNDGLKADNVSDIIVAVDSLFVSSFIKRKCFF